jgi:hypothetical protein
MIDVMPFCHTYEYFRFAFITFFYHSSAIYIGNSIHSFQQNKKEDWCDRIKPNHPYNTPIRIHHHRYNHGKNTAIKHMKRRNMKSFASINGTLLENCVRMSTRSWNFRNYGFPRVQLIIFLPSCSLLNPLHP